ncbi:hypothetical protein IWZ03DRAFT_380543 [Phyllosticta citriasiana]|uniref:Uncharacterized protein n=1 Tax=Phyllosticta citriasiana TaxID=595635 RepID=A0ABR1KK21_9PEZI
MSVPRAQALILANPHPLPTRRQTPSPTYWTRPHRIPSHRSPPSHRIPRHRSSAMASQKKDMRRDDLIIPYSQVEAKSDPDFAGTLASTLPMAAIFTRNKMVGWTAVIFALQTWLAETPETKSAASTPGIFTVGMSFMSLLVSYLPLFLPPPPVRAGAGSGTEAPAAAPPAQ